MATQNTEGPSEGRPASFQSSSSEALQLTQDATLQFVSAWFDGATELVTKMADMTNIPAVESLPEPSELLDFARTMIDAQQNFIQDAVNQSDPVSFISSLKAAQTVLLHKPTEVAAANARLAIGLDAAVRATLQCAAGAPVAPRSCPPRATSGSPTRRTRRIRSSCCSNSSTCSAVSS